MHLIKCYRKIYFKPKRKRNKRRGKLIKTKLRHRIFVPTLSKIKIKGYKYFIQLTPKDTVFKKLFKFIISKFFKNKKIYRILYLDKKNKRFNNNVTNYKIASNRY